MIKSYFKIAWRNLAGNKTESVINIIGLSVGMAVAMLIGLWIWDECSYEKYNPNYEQVAQVMQSATYNNEVSTGKVVPVPLAAELRTAYVNLFKHVAFSWWLRDHIVSFEDKRFTRKGTFMEPEGPGMLGLKMLKGNSTGFEDPSSILLSASTAKALFSDADPLGKVVKIDNKMTARVTGIYEDLPYNTQFSNVMFIAPWELLAAGDAELKALKTNWGYDAGEILVQLKDGVDINKAAAAIKNAKLNKVKENKELAAYKPVIFLHPMERWHLYSEFKNGVNTGGRVQFVLLFGMIGLFVLLLACINFMNLSTARSEKRAKEVGVRKALGSLKRQLIGQFISESLLAVAFAFVFSILLVLLSLPFFNEIADKKIHIPWANPWFWLSGIAFTFFTGLIAGSYPAFYLSSFQPIKVLKNTFRVGKSGAVPRKALVVLQFVVSITLIICTLVVFRQIQFAKSRPVGYSRDGLITMQMATPEFFGKEDVLRADLLSTGVVEEVAEAACPTTAVWYSASGFNWQGKGADVQDDFGVISVSYGYGKTVGWQFKDGRDFSKEFATDSSGLVLNEAAVAFMGLKDPVGQRVRWNERNLTVIGVVKNMLMESPYQPVRPTVYYLSNGTDVNFLFIKIKPTINVKASLSRIQPVFQKYIPSAPFDYKFVDEEFAKKFTTEERLEKLAGFFTLLTVFISCLGLFGMVAYMAEQRVKEIGIRKVLGASVFGLLVLLSKEFVVLVFISLLIATPMAYYFMHNWLQNYQYRSGISLWIFLVAGLAAMIITLLTVSLQAVKAALANPVKSLRSE